MLFILPIIITITFGTASTLYYADYLDRSESMKYSLSMSGKWEIDPILAAMVDADRVALNNLKNILILVCPIAGELTAIATVINKKMKKIKVIKKVTQRNNKYVEQIFILMIFYAFIVKSNTKNFIKTLKLL